MISFRYHVVSLVAVLLALAAGIAVGSGPLQRDTAADGSADGGALADVRAEATALENDVAFADAFAAATAGSLVGGALRDRAVTVVRLPGADDAVVENVSDLIARSGAAVTATVAVQPALLDVGRRQLVEELAAQMEDATEGSVEVPAGAGGYERLGLLLGSAVTTEEDAGQRPDDAGDSILAGLETAGLVTAADVTRRGSLVVVVTGPPYGSDDDRAGAGSVVAAVAAALDQRSDGVVVTGPAEAGQQGGVVAGVREDPVASQQVSTVDEAQRVAGAVVTVLALRAEAAGEGAGHYGSSDAPDGPVPGASGDSAADGAAGD